MNRSHAHRPDNLARLPSVTRDDVRALLWLIAFAGLFVAVTAVAGPG